MTTNMPEIYMEQYFEPCNMENLELDKSLMDYGCQGLVDTEPIKFIGETPPIISDARCGVFDLEYLMNNDPSIDIEEKFEPYMLRIEDVHSKIPENEQVKKVESKSQQKLITVQDEINEHKSTDGDNASSPSTQNLAAATPSIPKKKKVGRKPLRLGLTKRKDVVFKTVLRKVRKCFWTGINRFTGYQTKKSRHEIPLYYECVAEYVTKVLHLPATDKIIFLVGSMASPRDMQYFIELDPNKTYSKSKIEKCDDVHSALYLFNQKRYENEILKDPDMCRIMLTYFNRVDYTPACEDERIVGDMIMQNLIFHQYDV
jgi:hypothetical protein